ncbi:MAG TPA: hypothetical protein VLW52_02355 [Opitutaceae bacterium]|nr:hypothetical protein [Opitutaceae bacterium]
MDGHRNQIEPSRGAAAALAPGPGARTWWLVALAGTALMLGGRLELIREFGTSLPFRDQWKCTAADLLGPWVDGQLEPTAFLTPLNDHWVVLTRLLSFGLAWLDGQWNNLLETSVNALLHGAAIWLMLGTMAPPLGRRLGPVFVLYAGTVLALPYTWENTLWGIQSLVYFQVGLSLVYLWAAATRRHFTPGWWLGQLAGGLVLFTQQSSVLVHATVVLLLGWRWWRKDGDRRVTVAGFGFALLWSLVYFAFAPPLTVTAFLKADSWQIALDVCLRQLGWPLPHPGWAFLVYLPWLWLAGDRLRRRRLENGEAFILAVGLWVGAQAAAIGYGRGGDTVGFVSRYCDFLALGFLANAVCLGVLWRTTPLRPLRTAIVALAVAWFGLTALGLWHESVANHAGYNLERRPGINFQNLAAVRDFLRTGDATFLAQNRIGDTLYTYPPTVIDLLSKPRFRALLPPETGAREARADYGRLGAVARYLPPAGRWLAAAGLCAWLLASGFLQRTPAVVVPAPAPTPAGSRQPPRGGFGLWSVVTALALAAMLAWPQPLEFDAQQRWQAAYAPAAEQVEFIDPVFQSVQGPKLFPAEAVGAVATVPASVRAYWYGTRIAGSERFTGILRSAPTLVRHRFLFTPVSGWPNWPGNAVRWRFENAATGEVQWRAVSCAPTEPREAVLMWTEDVTPFYGWQVSLYLFDGLADEHGWVGVARPAATDDAGFGRRWLAQLRAGRAEPTHRVLAAVALAALTVWLVLAGWRFRQRGFSARPDPLAPGR